METTTETCVSQKIDWLGHLTWLAAFTESKQFFKQWGNTEGINALLEKLPNADTHTISELTLTLSDQEWSVIAAGMYSFTQDWDTDTQDLLKQLVEASQGFTELSEVEAADFHNVVTETIGSLSMSLYKQMAPRVNFTALTGNMMTITLQLNEPKGSGV